MLREGITGPDFLSNDCRIRNGMMGATQEVASLVAKARYRDIPPEVVRLARGFSLDGLGVTLAGSTDECSRIVQAQIRQMNGKGESAILGTSQSAPAAKAALANGVAGHAMDYDDTQLDFQRGGLRLVNAPDHARARGRFGCGRERENQR
jgi:hypothetical protein